MNFWTMLMIRANDDAKAVTDSHINRRCVEESAETIPGFLHGETMLSTEDPALVCLMCTGEDEAAYKAWIGSPVRNKQTEDLATMLADVNVSMANSCFKQLPATETDRDNAFPIGSYRAR